MNYQDPKDIWYYLSTLVPIVISITVAWIAWCQHQTNRSKLKLDLYNRRFAIYEKTLSYYLAFMARENDAAMLDKRSADFVGAYRESAFLFGVNSLAYKVLTDIKDTLSFRIQFERKFSDTSKDRDQHEYRAWSSKKDTLPDPSKQMEELEHALMEWLDFRRIAK
jgi:hypothetical protein